jgi:hypothetical protein
MNNNWYQPNNAQIEAEADADHAYAVANQANRAVAEWKQHAAQLVADHDKTMLDMRGRVRGESSIKQAALKELERFDPTNALFRLEYREELYQAAHREEIARILAERKAAAEKKRLEQEAAHKEARRKTRKQIRIFLIIAFLVILFIYMDTPKILLLRLLSS